jgi:heterodisulfide reductase subunit D
MHSTHGTFTPFHFARITTAARGKSRYTAVKEVARMTTNSDETEGFIDLFRARGAAIADACTRCGDCFRACPMTGPGGIGDADPGETAAAIVDLITGGAGNDNAIQWAELCSGSGNCIPACRHGINPRFMVQMARGFARRERAGAPLETRWRGHFQTMSRSVRVLSRLQLPPETLARFRGPPEARETPPDVVFYTGCNVLRTPHIALLALEVLDKLGTSYEVMGGVGQCCGVYQYREGDFANNSKMAHATIEGLASAGTSTVLSWCPSCQISIGEVSLPNYEAQTGEKPFDLNPFLVFLGDHAEELKALMVNRVEKRVALEERPVFPQTVEAVRKLAAIIPGLELVELDVPRVGVQGGQITPVAFRQALMEREFRLATEAGVDILATIHHADHRDICDAATGRSFEIVNFMELLGAGLGIDCDDAYKRLKQIKDIDDIIVETAPLIETHKLDLDTVRDALAWEFAG